MGLSAGADRSKKEKGDPAFLQYIKNKKMKQKNGDYVTEGKLRNTYGLDTEAIEKLFPVPDYDVPVYRKDGTRQKAWKRHTVQMILSTQRAKKEIRRGKREKRLRQAEHLNELQDFLGSYSLDDYIEKGKQIKRRFYLHVGETNSGKTYDSIMRMAQCSSGTYLAPLRLLALEIFEKLNDLGCPCDLVTGEEEERTEGAAFVSSTIELCDFSMQYDIAVIDEAQMIADPYRGANWTKAICLVNAPEVHICMAPEAENIVTEMIRDMEQEYETVRHQRLAPLIFSGECTGMDEIERGDCVIAFTRRNVLDIAAGLERRGMKTSVIYGALPPRSRREEVRRFTEGEAQVVVATDAIGMGISLPIKRIIFSTVTKFDGTQRRKLTFSEIKQIAGRAGRYGIYDEGYVLTMDDPGRVKAALETPSYQIRRLYIPFPKETLSSGYTLKELLEGWRTRPGNRAFRRENMEEAEFLYKTLGREYPKDSIRLIYGLITCSVDIKNGELVGYWKRCAESIIGGRYIPEPQFDCDDLEGCELQYRAYDIYHQLVSYTGQTDRSVEEKEKICELIKELMKEKGELQRKCSRCGRPLPAGYPFGICERCYRFRE